MRKPEGDDSIGVAGQKAHRTFHRASMFGERDDEVLRSNGDFAK